MKNYARFQDKIDVYRTISIIKDLTYLVGNSFKVSMKNDMLDFNMSNFFGINTCTGKVLCPLSVIWEFPSPGWVKINIDGAVRGSWSCYLLRYFPWEYGGVYWCFLCVF